MGEEGEEAGVEGGDLAVGRVRQVPQRLQPAAHERRALLSGVRRSRVEHDGEARHDAAVQRLADAEVEPREVGQRAQAAQLRRQMLVVQRTHESLHDPLLRHQRCAPVTALWCEASVRRAGQGTQGWAWRGTRAATHLRQRKQGARAGLANTGLAAVDEQAAQLTHRARLTDGEAALVQ